MWCESFADVVKLIGEASNEPTFCRITKEVITRILSGIDYKLCLKNTTLIIICMNAMHML